MRHFICPRICRYYKPGHSQEEGCGGVLWLERHPDQEAVLRDIPPDHTPSLFGQDCAPCGGLRALAWLLARGLAGGQSA